MNVYRFFRLCFLLGSIWYVLLLAILIVVHIRYNAPYFLFKTFGHGDSATNPSHFTAENNNGQIIVIELPGNNVSKAKIYQIETVPTNAGNPPVKLSFQDMNGDAKPDMLVQIGNEGAMLYVTLFNNGTEFVSKV